VLPATLSADVRRVAPDVLRCEFVLQTDLTRLALPARCSGERRDGLWRHTCFEVFVGAPEGSGYCEFNFSPGGDWAAYQFEDYRRGMSPAPLRAPPSVQLDTRPGRLSLTATLELGGLAALQHAAQLRLALAAVLEGAHGALSYWALRHAPGKPDFHHRTGFALELDAP
jgi:hypothetical protein